MSIPRPDRASEHIITLVEPIDDFDTTLDLARSVVVRGGDATVVMLMTKRVRAAIGAYADGARLRLADAEELAVKHFAHRSALRVGADIDTAVAHDRLGRLDLSSYRREGTTGVAVPERLFRSHTVRRLASTTGLPVLVAPRRAA